MESASKEKLVALLDQFKALRAEIAQRSSAQATIIHVNVIALGAIAGTYFTRATDDIRILFIIPVISPMLGLVWLDHNSAIRYLGNFIQKEINPFINRLLGEKLPDYEDFVDQLEQKKFERGLLLGVPVVVIFGVVPFFALVIPFIFGTIPGLREAVFLFALPGLIFLIIFAVFWFNSIFVKPRQ